MPEYLVTNPSASMQRMATIAGIIRRTVPARSANLSRRGDAQEQAAEDGGQEDGRPGRGERDDVDLGLLEILRAQGVSCPVTASPLATFRCSQRDLRLPRESRVEPVLDRGSPPAT